MGGARRTGDDVRRGRPAARRDVRALLALQRRYDAATRRLFAAVDAGDLDAARRVEQEDVDPVFGVLEDGVARATRTATSSGLRYSTELKTVRGNVLVHSAFAFAFGIGLLAGVVRLMLRLRARLTAARRAEVERLAHIAMTDPLTGLRNHRAFQEDLARELQRAGRTAAPLARAHGRRRAQGRQRRRRAPGRRRAPAGARRGDPRRAARDRPRLPDRQRRVRRHPPRRARSARWSSPSACARSRGRARTASRSSRPPGSPRRSACARATTSSARPTSPHRGQARAPARRGLRPRPRIRERWSGARDARRRPPHPDARARFARAVDAKDSYTRSHCQTVSRLSATIAAELCFTGERLGRMRLAGLLHDVGKIGVPDAILNKPAKLTAAEYALMQRHAVLGCDIVRAADMPDEARWVRHHHERYDGGGYPARSSRSPSCAATRAPSSTPRSSTRCAVCSTAAAPPAPPAPPSRRPPDRRAAPAVRPQRG